MIYLQSVLLCCTWVHVNVLVSSVTKISYSWLQCSSDMSDQRIRKMWETKMNWMTGKIFCFHILFVAMKVAEGNPRPLPARSGSPVCKVRVIIKACFVIYGIWHKLTCNLSKWFTTGDDGLSSNMTIGVGISHFFKFLWRPVNSTFWDCRRHFFWQPFSK